MSALTSPTLESEKRPVFDILMTVALPMSCSEATVSAPESHELLTDHLLCHCNAETS